MAGDFLGEEHLDDDELSMPLAHPSSSDASEPVTRLQAASAAVEVCVVAMRRNIGLLVGRICAWHHLMQHEAVIYSFLSKQLLVGSLVGVSTSHHVSQVSALTPTARALYHINSCFDNGSTDIFETNPRLDHQSPV